MLLAGWGRYPRFETTLVEPTSPASLAQCQATLKHAVARGNGRSYGDAAIGLETTASMCGLNRMLSFDPATNLLTVEAGVLLADIIAAFLPRGLFPPVVPGTKFVTIGGMIAADVHGKNHHRVGGFGDHVSDMTLVLPSGETVACSRDRHPDLFFGTIGGMGLTGAIVQASFRLTPVETGWIRQRTLVARNLDDPLRTLTDGDGATYSVAWIDCLARGPALGRSLVYLGEHATGDDLAALRPGADVMPPDSHGRIGVPVDLPGFTLNRLSVAAFNELYFRRGAVNDGAPSLIGWDPYFFPLDRIAAWNRIYGRRGFLQHQCVIPTAAAGPVLQDILHRVSQRGDASFLAVLKKLTGGSGLMSFPLPGFTLALDLRMTDGVFDFLDEIDRLVVAAGGRLYLAKDARQSAATFAASYHGLPALRRLRHEIGAAGHISSRLSARLGI